jgi:hypothetical protein
MAELSPEYLTLVNEALERGIRISPKKALRIWKVHYRIPGISTDIMGIETGYAAKHNGVWLEHIMVKHGKEFVGIGITRTSIPKLAKALTTADV